MTGCEVDSLVGLVADVLVPCAGPLPLDEHAATRSAIATSTPAARALVVLGWRPCEETIIGRIVHGRR